MKVVWLVVVLIACRKPAPAELNAPTVEEATAFAAEFIKHMSPCDRDAVARDLDIELLVRLAGVRLSESGNANLKSELLPLLAEALCGATAPVGDHVPTYSLLQVRTVKGQPQPLIRLSSPLGVTYHELLLDKQPDRIRIADVRLYSTGESLSEIFASLIAAVDNSTQVQPLIEAKQKLAAGDAAGARMIVMYLPKAVRQTKAVMMFDVRAASRVGEAELLEAAEAINARYPNDPALDLLGIELGLVRKDYKAVLAHVDALDQRIGGDPLLDVHRVEAHLGLGQPAQALTFAKRGTERMPEEQDVWWALLTAQTASKQFSAAITTLTHLKTKFELTIDAAQLRADPRFVTLADSAEFAAMPR